MLLLHAHDRFAERRSKIVANTQDSCQYTKGLKMISGAPAKHDAKESDMTKDCSLCCGADMRGSRDAGVNTVYLSIQFDHVHLPVSAKL
jgi:hypothetical protein